MLYLNGKNTNKLLNIVILLIYEHVFFLSYNLELNSNTLFFLIKLTVIDFFIMYGVI